VRPQTGLRGPAHLIIIRTAAKTTLGSLGLHTSSLQFRVTDLTPPKSKQVDVQLSILFTSNRQLWHLQVTEGTIPCPAFQPPLLLDDSLLWPLHATPPQSRSPLPELTLLLVRLSSSSNHQLLHSGRKLLRKVRTDGVHGGEPQIRPHRVSDQPYLLQLWRDMLESRRL